MLKLCTADNLGIRYRLMHLYAYLEDTAGAAQLHARYEDCDDPHLLLPLIVLYYKLEDLQTAGSFLSRLAGRNKNTRAFFSAAARDRLYEYYDELEPFGYQLGSIGELICCLDQNIYLYDTVPCFFSWANQYLKQKKK